MQLEGPEPADEKRDHGNAEAREEHDGVAVDKTHDHEPDTNDKQREPVGAASKEWEQGTNAERLGRMQLVPAARCASPRDAEVVTREGRETRA